MIKLLVASKIKKFTFAISFFIVYSCVGQHSTIENSYGVPNETWTSYYQRTEALLKQIDVESFMNYVIFTSDGKMADKSFFQKHISVQHKKDKAELVYRVGKGTITTIPEVKTYLASLQPAYINLFKEFQQKREEIIESQTQYRAPSGGTTPVPFNCGSPCTNPGFEAGTGFWDYWSGNACASSTSDPCSLVAGYSAAQHQLQTVGGNDPMVGAALPVVPPGGGNNSMMLGDGPVTGGWASRASISFTVSAANANFSYKYAVVLQDPVSGHLDPERPYFNVRLRDASGNVVPCGDYEVLAKPPIVGFTETSPGSAVWYRTWTSVFVPLSSYIGQCVTIMFTSSDCSQGGHFGYAYIDADCDPLQLVASSPAVCGGSSVTLTAPAGGAAYSWSNTAGGTTGIVGSTTGQTCVVNQGGTYQVIVTSVSGPTCTTTLNITVGSSPSNPVPSFTNTVVCSGAPTDFTDTSTPSGSITAWNWDFNNDGVTDNTIQNPSYTFPAAGTYPVTLTITMGPCNATIIQNVTVNPGAFPISPAGAYCEDEPPVNLTASPAGGTWSGTGITDAVNGTFDPAFAVVGNNTITYSVGGACPGFSTSTIVVKPLPISEAGPIVNICSGTAATIGTAATAGYSYSWLPATGLSLASLPNPSITTINSGTTSILTTYTVTTTINSCTSSDTVTVIVDPQPVLTITNPAAVCSPDIVDITVAAVTTGSTGGGTLTYWTDAAGTIALAAPTAITVSGTYYIKVTATGGCTDIDPVVVSINPLPVSDAGTDVTICSGVAATIGTASVAGNNYSWLAATGLSAANVSNPSITTTNPGTTPIVTTYTVTTTVALTGCTSTDDVTVTVNPQPVLTITDPAGVCSPDIVDITAAAITAGSTGGGVLTYWTDAAGTIALAAPTAITISGTYYIKVTATGGCTDIDPVVVSINPLPVSDAGTDVTICSGVAATIGTASVAGNNYSWSPATGLSAANVSNPSITTINTVTTPMVTTYTVTTTVTLTGCLTIDSVMVIVYPQPVLTITDPAAVCSPDNVDITTSVITAGSTGGGTLTYWTDAAGTIALAAPTAITISGTYYIKVTATGGCTDIDPVVVTINPLPVSNAGTDVTICSGIAANIGTVADAGNNYSWLPATGLSATNVSNPSITTTNPGTAPIITTYTVTTTVALTGCSTADSVLVTVNPQPVLTITDPAAVCFPNTVDITVAAVTAGSTGGGTLTYWTDAAGTIALAAPTAVNTSGTYYIKVTAAGGCTDIDPVIVTVNPLPVSNAGTDVSICTGIAANIGTTTIAGNGYSWLPATGLSAANVSDPSITTTNPGTTPIVTTYTVTTTILATGCSTTDEVVVTVHPLPVLVITDPAPICFPGVVDITLSAITAGTIGTGTLTYWTDPAGTIPLVGPVPVSASGTYYIRITTAAGCSDMDSVLVIIYPLPVSNAGSDIVICTGSFGTIGSASSAGYTYSWSPSTGLSNPALSNPSVILTNLGSAASTSSYTVTTTENGCSTSDTVDVTVNPLPTANAGSPQYVCTGKSLTLNGYVTGGTGIWSGGAGTFNPGNTTMNAVYNPTAAEYAAGSVTLTLTTIVTSGPCPNSSSLVPLNFWPKPIVDFSVVDPFGCPIVCAKFTDNSSVGVVGVDYISDWNWNFGDNTSSTTQNPDHCYPVTGFYDVTLIVTSNNFCKDTLTQVHIVEVYPKPVAEFTPDPNPASILNPLVTLINGSSSDVTNWYYYFGDGDSIAPSTPSPAHMYPTSQPDTYTATLYVQNSYNCWDTVQHDIVISPEFTFFIPNAFTPNEDGVNDYFYGQGIGIEKYDIYIFDRWGNMIYHGDNIYASKWDGRANKGRDVAQQDVYVWKVALTDIFGKKHNYIGTVTIVK